MEGGGGGERDTYYIPHILRYPGKSSCTMLCCNNKYLTVTEGLLRP